MMSGDDGGAAEAEYQIQNALAMAQEAAESFDLEDRYSALALAEETAAEHGLMYVLPKYCAPYPLSLCMPSAAPTWPHNDCTTRSNAHWVPLLHAGNPYDLSMKVCFFVGKRLDENLQLASLHEFDALYCCRDWHRSLTSDVRPTSLAICTRASQYAQYSNELPGCHI